MLHAIKLLDQFDDGVEVIIHGVCRLGHDRQGKNQ
jgi:hypothetical protein